MQCCHVHPADFPWKRIGWGPASSHKQQEQSPDDHSPPPSTSPGAGRSRGVLDFLAVYLFVKILLQSIFIAPPGRHINIWHYQKVYCVSQDSFKIMEAIQEDFFLCSAVLNQPSGFLSSHLHFNKETVCGQAALPVQHSSRWRGILGPICTVLCNRIGAKLQRRQGKSRYDVTGSFGLFNTT